MPMRLALPGHVWLRRSTRAASLRASRSTPHPAQDALAALGNGRLLQLIENARIERENSPHEREAQQHARAAATAPTPEHAPEPAVHEGVSTPGISAAGRPLDATTRERMEGYFGQDLSDVRVHSDREAAEAAGLLNAEAFTVGRDVFFADSKYAPGAHAGDRLIAHEITHVAQQAASGDRGSIQRQAAPLNYGKVVKAVAAQDAKLAAYLAKVTPGGGSAEILRESTKFGTQSVVFVYNLKFDQTPGALSAAQFEQGAISKRTGSSATTYTFDMIIRIDPGQVTSVDLYHEGVHMLLFMDEMLSGFGKESKYHRPHQDYLTAAKASSTYAGQLAAWTMLFTQLKVFVGKEKKVAAETIADGVEEKFVMDQEAKQFGTSMSNQTLSELQFKKIVFQVKKLSSLKVKDQDAAVAACEKAIVDKTKQMLDEIDAKMTPTPTTTPTTTPKAAPATTPKK